MIRGLSTSHAVSTADWHPEMLLLLSIAYLSLTYPGRA
jgi:hypothetical protein